MNVMESVNWAWVKIDLNWRLGPGPPNPEPRTSHIHLAIDLEGKLGSVAPHWVWILIRNQSKSSQYLWRSMVTSAEEFATWARVAFSATASLVGLAARLARCYQPHLPRNPSSRHPVHLLGTWRVSSQASPNLWYYQIFCMHSGCVSENPRNLLYINMFARFQSLHPNQSRIAFCTCQQPSKTVSQSGAI